MTTHVLRVATFVAALVLSGCSAPTLRDNLTATRNIDVLTLFGSDTKTATAAAPLDVSWRVLASPTVILSDRAGTVAGAPLRIEGRAALETADHAVPTRYQISWSGLRDTQPNAPSKITLRDAAGARALTLQFEGNKMRVISADKEFTQPVFSTTQAHQVNLILNMGPKPTIAVKITQGNEEIYTSHPLNVINASFTRLDAVVIDVTSSDGSYHIADFAAVPVS